MASRKPSFRFFHSTALRTRTNKVLDAIEWQPEPTTQAEALSSVALSLGEAGLEC